MEHSSVRYGVLLCKVRSIALYNQEHIWVLRASGSQSLHPLSSNHTSDADDDKRNREQLAHIERHTCFEINLYILRVFDEEAERENERENETEEESTSDRLDDALGFKCLLSCLLSLPFREGLGVGLLTSLISPQHDEEEAEVCQSLIELSRMARNVIYLLENECPGYISRLADDF